jgi:hypothetical protein
MENETLSNGSTSVKPSKLKKQITFLAFLQGKVDKSFLLHKIIPISYVIYIIGILIADLLYPNAFDWRYMVISELGNSASNPQGYYFSVIAGLIMGIMIIPFVGYVYRHLSIICRFTTFIGCLFCAIGLIGLIALGVTTFIPNMPNRTHENLAMTGFAGLILAIFFWGFPLIKDRLKRYHGLRQFNFKLMLLGFISIWSVVLSAGGAALYIEVAKVNWGWVSLDWLTLNPHPPVLASLALWEWAGVFCILLFYFLLIQMMPEEVKPLKP